MLLKLDADPLPSLPPATRIARGSLRWVGERQAVTRAAVMRATAWPSIVCGAAREKSG